MTQLQVKSGLVHTALDVRLMITEEVQQPAEHQQLSQPTNSVFITQQLLQSLT
jgi:hypothetical protein